MIATKKIISSGHNKKGVTEKAIAENLNASTLYEKGKQMMILAFHPLVSWSDFIFTESLKGRQATVL